MKKKKVPNGSVRYADCTPLSRHINSVGGRLCHPLVDLEVVGEKPTLIRSSNAECKVQSAKCKSAKQAMVSVEFCVQCCDGYSTEDPLFRG